jgi:phosphodiesterase/alkaline phosphatase D-like protein
MRHLLLAAALVGTLAALPSIATAASFSAGVSSAEATSNSILLWTRAPKAGKVQLVVGIDKRFAKKRIVKSLSAKSGNDLTVQSRVRALQAGKTYFYYFIQGKKRSDVGTFKTAPKSGTSKTIRFAVTGDADPAKKNGKNVRNPEGAADMATYQAMQKERNDFNVNLGDTIYSDSAISRSVGYPLAFSLAQKRERYKLLLTYRKLLALRKSGVVYNQWDDHEFVDDFNRQSEACDVGSTSADQYACPVKTIWSAGVKAFREYMPVTYSARNGTYRTFRWGKNLEIFILDERAFRSIRASEIKVNPNAPEPTAHICENGGNDDLAPRVPQRIRNLFALVAPSLANPTPQACLDALNSPQRTMLGARQYNAFTSAIKKSNAKWKVIINEVPMMEFGINPYDDWEGYEYEREKLLTYLKDNVKNVAIVTTDFHTNWVNDARIKTYPEQGGPVNSGIKEFIAGGVADDLFGNELDDAAGRPGTWPLVDSAYLLKQPPDGPGMECSNMITFGYVQVEAGAKSLKVVLKDNKGRQMANASGDKKPCGPWTISAK